jgi:hypothetical protein
MGLVGREFEPADHFPADEEESASLAAVAAAWRDMPLLVTFNWTQARD